MVLEEFSGYIWVAIIGTIGVIAFKIQRSYNIQKSKEEIKFQRQVEKEKPADELSAYLMNPEATIEALMKQREIFKDDVGKTANIDQQIKMLELVAKIPGPIRPTMVKLGKKLIGSIEGGLGGI